jgi:hypothetical protein
VRDGAQHDATTRIWDFRKGAAVAAILHQKIRLFQRPKASPRSPAVAIARTYPARERPVALRRRRRFNRIFEIGPIGTRDRARWSADL